MASEFSDLIWAQGSDNMGGLRGKIFYCPTEDILSEPTIATDKITYTGNYVCKTGKNFVSIYHTLGTGKIDDGTVGERDGKSVENTLEFFFPGGKKEVAAFKRRAQNTPCIVIAKDSDNNYRVIGSLDLPAYLESGSGTTGAASADRRGTTFQFKAEAAHPPMFYEGTVPLTPAV
jgi:hypothetical protein